MTDTGAKRPILLTTLDAVERRILHPVVDRGFAPASEAGAELELSWKGAVVDFAIEGCAAGRRFLCPRGNFRKRRSLNGPLTEARYAQFPMGDRCRAVSGCGPVAHTGRMGGKGPGSTLFGLRPSTRPRVVSPPSIHDLTTAGPRLWLAANRARTITDARPPKGRGLGGGAAGGGDDVPRAQPASGGPHEHACHRRSPHIGRLQG